MRVLIVEDEPYLAEAIRDGLRLEAIAADIAGDGDTVLELLSINTYDLGVLDRRRAHNRPSAQTPRQTLGHRHHAGRRLPHRHSTRHRAWEY